jgi:sugar phosphate isomerase/epimerase
MHSNPRFSARDKRSAEEGRNRVSIVGLAIGDQTLPLLSHEQMLDIGVLLGFEAVDLILAGGRSQLVLSDVRKDIPAWAGRIEERLRQRRLATADLFVLPWTDFQTLAPNHPDASERLRSRELFHDVLEFAARIGAPGMTILPGVDWDDESHDDSLARAAEELSWRAAQAHERGLRFSVEGHIGSVIEHPAEALRLVEVAERVELTLDYGHFIARGFQDADIEPLIPHSRHFHARCARPERLQSSMKENTIDFERIVDLMQESGYNGYLGLEYVWVDWEHCNECDNISETVLLKHRLEAKLAGRSWTYAESPI